LFFVIKTKLLSLNNQFILNLTSNIMALGMELEMILRLLFAVGLGSIIGLEREIMHKPAGLRTNALVCLGSCLFTVISVQYFGLDYARLAAGIVGGIGFIGAGIIINSGREIQGITTAATLWTVAAIGIGVGIGAYIICAAATVIAITVLKMKIIEKPMVREVRRIERRKR
jgi:putative Mg2+ transporter-C (MgtC) family protein